MASMILKQSASTQAEVRMSRIETTNRGYAQQNLSILLFISLILMFLVYTTLNISKLVKFIQKKRKTKRKRRTKKNSQDRNALKPF